MNIIIVEEAIDLPASKCIIPCKSHCWGHQDVIVDHDGLIVEYWGRASLNIFVFGYLSVNFVIK